MKKVLVVVVIVVVLLGIGGQTASVYVDTRNTGRATELALVADYNGMIAHYGQNRMTVVDQLGISREKARRMNQILDAAVSGRYNKPGSTTAVDNGKLFSAIAEAYPDLTGLNVYDKILVFVQTARKNFGDDQAHLQTSIQNYKTWLTTGSLLHPMIAQWLFPSNTLEIKVGDQVYHGQEALDHMLKPIVGSDTNEIFNSSVDKPMTDGGGQTQQ